MNQYTIHFETLGCRLNQDETEGAARSFANNGFNTDLELVSAKSPVTSDTILCMINTCTVTGKAEQKARRIIRLMLQKFPNAPVIVTGCYAELDSADIKAIAPDRISVLSGTKKYLLAQIAREIKDDGLLSYSKGFLSASNLDKYILDQCSSQDSRTRKIFAPDSSTSTTSIDNLNMFSLYTPVFEKHSRSSLKIQDGCNNACAFCRIHLARGLSISLDADIVIQRAKELESLGMAEIVLTGVNLCQYSWFDKDGNNVKFAGLLERLLEETKTVRYRISSLYPQYIDDRLCKVISSSRIQPFFHLSIQSGSDRILKSMRRPYDRETVIRAVARLRQYKENPFISCDIIAGFPGEMEEDFSDTMSLCEECNFSWIHAFPFSPRPGTPAYTMKPQIPDRIKGERVKWLTDKAVQGKLSYIESYVGKELEAIAENSRSQRLGTDTKPVLHAVTSNFIHVECDCDGKDIPSGSIVKVCITASDTQSILSGKETEARAILQSE